LKTAIVIDYGASIGIPYRWYRNVRPYYSWKNDWHDILHELGHLAVYPQEALIEYQEARQRAAAAGRACWGLLTPGLIDAGQAASAAQNFFCNEYAVRCWCLDALQLLELPNPIHEAGYGDYPPGKRPRNLAQWLEPPEFFGGREQLFNWGIDVLGGKPRPNSEPLELVCGAYCPFDRSEFAAQVEAAVVRLDGTAALSNPMRLDLEDGSNLQMLISGQGVDPASSIDPCLGSRVSVERISRLLDDFSG
jgi:hypothetical protein